jgi:hypothetical protein
MGDRNSAIACPGGQSQTQTGKKRDIEFVDLNTGLQVQTQSISYLAGSVFVRLTVALGL